VPDVLVLRSILDIYARHNMVFVRVLMRKRGMVVEPRAGPTPSLQPRRWRACEAVEASARWERWRSSPGSGRASGVSCKAWLGWPGDRELCPAYNSLFRFLVRNTGTYVATVTSMSPVILDDYARHKTAFSASWCEIRERTSRLTPRCRLLFLTIMPGIKQPFPLPSAEYRNLRCDCYLNVACYS
jgi:hypothetical protein